MMGRATTAKLALVLVLLQAISPLFPLTTTANDFLSPLLSPVFDGICKEVGCGKGKCKASTNTIVGFECECDQGWTQLHIGDNLRFLPCVIPNCSVNYSCYNDSSAGVPSPPPTNASISDPCMLAYCGGGTCLKRSEFDHKCECKKGYSNLLNINALPCYRDCSLGADCANLGITLPNSSSPPSPSSLSDSTNSLAGGAVSPNYLVALLVFASIVMVRAT
ncbi:delta-like protein C [Ananas comosus]|uniref:Delta-like protein C n=1 Tax=Ananas comosus TaxID=4615 RepID=A0A6P5G9L0_ANACO|nr:delta-like protein C [Ananas comosus]